MTVVEPTCDCHCPLVVCGVCDAIVCGECGKEYSEVTKK